MKRGYLLFLVFLFIAGLLIFLDENSAEEGKEAIVNQTDEVMIPSKTDKQLEPHLEDGFRIYTVQKGDTLWDITHNILKESFLWPKVWNANSDIKNPDLIYPGQKIKIPISVLKPELISKEQEIKPEEVEALKEKEVSPEVKGLIRKTEKQRVSLKPSELPDEKRPEYLIDKNLLLESGYISRNIPDAGRIIGSPSERSAMGKGDYVYIKTSSETKKGEKFYVIRPVSEVKHPDTREFLGHLVEINGIIEVLGEESGMIKAEVKESFKEINTGDRLDNFYLIEPPLKPEITDFPKINATIVATRHLYTITGSAYDIVYIDKGSRDGLTAGSLLNIFSKKRPVVLLGTIQVINVKDETATAVVRKGLREIVVGDRIINE